MATKQQITLVTSIPFTSYVGLHVKLAELENVPAAEAEIPHTLLTVSGSFSSGDTHASLLFVKQGNIFIHTSLTGRISAKP